MITQDSITHPTALKKFAAKEPAPELLHLKGVTVARTVVALVGLAASLDSLSKYI